MGDTDAFFDQYGAYLEEARRRLYRIAIVFAAAFVLGLFSTAALLPLFVRLFAVPSVTIVATSPFQLLELAMSAGFFSAIVITLPFAFQQAYAFARKALLPRERSAILWLIPLSIFLFAAGFSYGFAVMYYAIFAIAQVNTGFGITNLWNVSQFISQILITAALLGVIFQFPLILSGLIHIRAVSAGMLRRNRRVAWAAICIFTALLPPTDGLSFIVMSLPLVALYELTILANSRGPRKELLSA